MAALDEAITLQRELVRREPDRHRPELAESLTFLSTLMLDNRQDERALTALRESFLLLKACCEHDPETYRSASETAEANLRSLLAQLGRHEEAVLPDLTTAVRPGPR